MRAYPKIETLYDRDPATFKVKVGDYRRPEFAAIDRWFVTEKIDGTNIRIDWRRLPDDRDVVTSAIGGRTDNAQIPAKLLAALQDVMFKADTEVKAILDEFNIDSYTLFGEGYGASIQKGGGNYREDQGFILFDVLVNDRTWLGPFDVGYAADRLGIDMVPTINCFTTKEIVSLVEKGYDSLQAGVKGFGAEGIVAVPLTPLYDGRGNRVQFKLKTRDFLGGKH